MATSGVGSFGGPMSALFCLNREIRRDEIKASTTNNDDGIGSGQVHKLWS